jgi:hypothetical protein
MNNVPFGSYLFQSTFSGCALTVYLPKLVVIDWIPRGSDLEAIHEHLHPIVFLFGDQQRGAVVYGDRVVTAPITYNEWAALVPGVYLPGQAGPFTFVAGMVCNYPVARFFGNTYYGYRKRLGTLLWKGRNCEVSVGKPIMRMALDQPTACDAEAATALFTHLQSPVLGLNANGDFMFSHWNFDPAIAEFWRVGARVEVDRRFAPGVSPFAAAVSRDDGFMLRGLPWQLSAPARS